MSAASYGSYLTLLGNTSKYIDWNLSFAFQIMLEYVLCVLPYVKSGANLNDKIYLSFEKVYQYKLINSHILYIFYTHTHTHTRIYSVYVVIYIYLYVP